MKTPSLALINSIGFSNWGQRVLWCAHVLKAATTNSPAQVLVPAVPAVVGRPAVLAQTAKAARPASPAIAANPANPARAFGELFLNSPALAAGAAVPAFPAKPASAEVIGVPAVIARAAVPAVSSPAVVAIPGYSQAIQIVKSPSQIQVDAYLPLAQGGLLLGNDGIEKIIEITPSTLTITRWLEEPASTEPDEFTTAAYLSSTVEEWLAYCAFNAINEDCQGNIATIYHTFDGGMERLCKHVSLTLDAGLSHNENSFLPQLKQINYFFGGGGGGSEPITSPS